MKWDNGAAVNAGAVTWGDGTAGVAGAVAVTNSLVGTIAGDLATGVDADAGAATWADGSTGLVGAVAPANSLIGAASDAVGNGVTALTNGHYVVISSAWNGPFGSGAGAVTWADGDTGLVGGVSSSNSLVGVLTLDSIGGTGVTALSNGNYVVRSASWRFQSNPLRAGAVTWADGSSGLVGEVSEANSLVGTSADDMVGSTGVVALANGNYVVVSRDWNNGSTVDAGAVTWADGSTGLVGEVSGANSLVATTANDRLANVDVIAFSDGRYVVRSSLWDDGATVDAGAVTLGRGDVALIGAIEPANSVRGTVSGGGAGLMYGYDAARGQLAVGRPRSNILSLFDLNPPPDLILSDGFE